MTLLKNKIKKSGIKIYKIAEELNIEKRTLQRWIKYENIDNFIKFLLLIKKFNINIDEIIKDYKNKKYK